MNEQRQSPLFRLPCELRLQIYRQYLFNGGHMQHLEIDYYTERITRRACNPEPDEDVLRRELASHSKTATTFKYWLASTYQNGHLGCLTSPVLSAGSDPGNLLRTCRRIQAEVSPEFYSLHFHDSRDLTAALLGNTYLRSAAERIASIECPCSSSMPEWAFDEFKQTLALMKNLKRLRLEVSGAVPVPPDSMSTLKRGDTCKSRNEPICAAWLRTKKLPPQLADLFLEMGCEKMEIEFRNSSPERDEITVYPTENKLLVVRALRNSAWTYGIDDILKDGVKGLERVQERYIQQQTDLDQARNVVSCIAV